MTLDVRVTIVPRLPDEPPFWLAYAVAACAECGHRIVGYGAGVDEASARIRARGEHAERASLHEVSEHRPDAVVWDSETGLGAAVPLAEFAGRPVAADPGSPRAWWPATHARTGAEAFLPVEAAILQLPGRGVAAIREPLTTGTAAHEDAQSAGEGALREVIERDAYMRAVTGETAPRRLASPAALAPTLELLAARYRLDAALFALPARAGQIAVMALLLDPTGHGVAVTCGLACASALDRAAEKAMLEAWQPRVPFRALLEAGAVAPERQALIRDARDRGLHWSRRERIDQLRPLLDLPPQPPPDAARADILAAVNEQGIEVYTVALPSVHDAYVKRVVCPQLHPLYLDETFRDRDPIAALDPHPFL